VNGIRQIARLTFVEMVRNRILYGVFAFVVILLLVSAALASVTMGRTELMIHDMGLGLISILANLTAIVFVIQSLQQDRDNRNLYVLLTRLPARSHYMLGKFAGVAAVQAGLVVLMYLALAALVRVFGSIHWLSSVQAALATILESWMVAAVALVFAQTSSLFLAVLLTLSVDVAGRFTSVIHDLGQHSNQAFVKGLSALAYYVLPNLEGVNLRGDAGYVVSYAGSRLAHVLGYGLAETALLVAVACWIFSRRNLS